MLEITLIGNGFVGKNLLKDFGPQITNCYNSKNIKNLCEKKHDVIFCAAPSGKKWLANKNPEDDEKSCNLLIDCLKVTNFNKIILFSTIDVFKDTSKNCTEACQDFSQEPYGKNRRRIEEFVLASGGTVIRMPALFGKFLEKNYVFDLMTKNDLKNVKSNSQFQWFFIDRLKDFLRFADENNVNVLNLAVEPIATKKLIETFFHSLAEQVDYESDGKSYNMTTLYSETGYFLSSKEVLRDFEVFLQE